jgi:hypothetical protein
MTLPRSLDDALAFLGNLTPTDWAAFRLGLGTVLTIVAVAGLAVAVWAAAVRR